MSTAQDQQSRAKFEAWARRACYEVRRHDSGQYARNTTEQVWQAWQAARALPARGVDPMLDTPAGMELVATIASIDEHGPCFEWRQHWANFPIGTNLYTAAQVLAMVAHRGRGEDVNQPQTRMDAGAHGGRGLPPDQLPCRVNLMYHGPSNCLMGTVGCFVDSHRGRGRLPAAPATTEPQTSTTGAGSVTAGAAPAYRLLQRGVDTIQAGDEFLQDDAVTWQPDPNGIFVGITYVGNVLLPARRAIEPAHGLK